jgi:hypothetical protein
MSASNSRYLTCYAGDDFDWRFHVGVLRHDNVPCFWNPDKECWEPRADSASDGAVAEVP